jgi:hypothetical protein
MPMRVAADNMDGEPNGQSITSTVGNFGRINSNINTTEQLGGGYKSRRALEPEQ